MSAKVVVANLEKRYGAVRAADGVSFEVLEGEVFGLLGPNGAGKTTTIECVIGLRQPDGGTVQVCGIDARREPLEMKQKIGAVLQSTALQDKITPREALRLFGSLYRERVDPEELLERFSLTEKADEAFDSLSGGQRQRLALAMAFVNRPELIFLDEPTAGVDAQTRQDLYGEILRMKGEGRTVLLTTHYIEEAERLCDRVAIIDRGKIIATGSPRELIARSATAPVVSFVTTQPISRERLASLSSIEELVCDGMECRFRAVDARRTLAELMALLIVEGVELTELHVRKTSLENVFIELTSAGSRE